MTKRILTVLAMVSIAAMMMLSSCTAAGVECGLIGKWESVNESSYYEGEKNTIEITADDKIIFTSPEKDYETGKIKLETTKGTIEEVTGKAIIYKNDKATEKSVLEYSELSGDTVKFYGSTFKKVQ